MRRTLPVFGVIIACIWLAYVGIAFSNVGTNLTAFLIAFCGGIIWIVVWLIRMIVWWLCRKKRIAQPLRQPVLYWSFEPTILILSAALVFSGLLSSVRFHLSKSALQIYAEAVRSGRISPNGQGEQGRHVGLYTATETELVTNGVVRLITSENGFNDAGFVYSPSNTPPVLGEDYYVQAADSWWYWYRNW